jgi:hypothetical protein
VRVPAPRPTARAASRRRHRGRTCRSDRRPHAGPEAGLAAPHRLAPAGRPPWAGTRGRGRVVRVRIGSAYRGAEGQAADERAGPPPTPATTSVPPPPCHPPAQAGLGRPSPGSKTSITRNTTAHLFMHLAKAAVSTLSSCACHAPLPIERATRQELPELPLDELGEAGPRASLPGLAQGSLQMLADDLMELGALGVSQSIHGL